MALDNLKKKRASRKARERTKELSKGLNNMGKNKIPGHLSAPVNMGSSRRLQKTDLSSRTGRGQRSRNNATVGSMLHDFSQPIPREDVEEEQKKNEQLFAKVVLLETIITGMEEKLTTMEEMIRNINNEVT